MKKILFLITLLIVVACGSNGLNKPITQELTSEELRVNLKRNPEFEQAYKDYRDIAEWIMSDNVREAKYGNITYKQAERYYNFRLNVEDVEREHKTMFPNRDELRARADSLIRYYRSVQPDSLLVLSFVNKTVRGGMFSTAVFHIEATPLKGTVEQFGFNYYFSPKMNGDNAFNDTYPLMRYGRYERPISEKTIFTDLGNWYGDVLQNVSVEELKRDYNFLYKITNVRYNGENWNDLPFALRWCIEKEELYDWDRDNIIQEVIEPKYIPLNTFYTDKLLATAREKYPDVAPLFDEYRSDEQWHKAKLSD